MVALGHRGDRPPRRARRGAAGPRAPRRRRAARPPASRSPCTTVMETVAASFAPRAPRRAATLVVESASAARRRRRPRPPAPGARQPRRQRPALRRGRRAPRRARRRAIGSRCTCATRAPASRPASSRVPSIASRAASGESRARLRPGAGDRRGGGRRARRQRACRERARRRRRRVDRAALPGRGAFHRRFMKAHEMGGVMTKNRSLIVPAVVPASRCSPSPSSTSSTARRAAVVHPWPRGRLLAPPHQARHRGAHRRPGLLHLRVVSERPGGYGSICPDVTLKTALLRVAEDREAPAVGQASSASRAARRPARPPGRRWRRVLQAK